MGNSKYRFFLVCFILVLGQISEIRAIPAFARRYKISCSTCHAPFPKLKAYGEDFAGAGMILKEEEKARDYISAGDDLLWLNRDFPIAARFEAYGLFEDQNIKSDLQTPWGLKLMSGGALFKNIGYYFYFYMSEQGEVAGIEDAYLHFDNVFGSNLDLMVGQFQTSDPLMKRELRLTFEDYVIYETKVGASQTNLTYDRGLMLVYGLDRTGTEFVGQIVNGNGKDESGEDHLFDQDDWKNFGFRIRQDLGILSLGAYIYHGNEMIEDAKNRIFYWGPDFNVSVGSLELTAQYLERKDSNAGPVDQPETRTRGTVVEAI
jgi:hypothetical protein